VLHVSRRNEAPIITGGRRYTGERRVYPGPKGGRTVLTIGILVKRNRGGEEGMKIRTSHYANYESSARETESRRSQVGSKFS